MRSSCMTVRVPAPPGTTRISGCGTSANDFSTSMVNIRVSVLTGPGSAATKSTRAPGRRESTSYGPTASSAVKRSNNGIAICISIISSGLKSLPVFRGAHAQTAVEGASHRLDGAEAALARDRLELLGSRLEPDPRLTDAQRLHVRGRRHAELAAERAREVARAHAGLRGQPLDRQVLAEVVGKPRLQLAQRLAVGQLGPEVRAELRLAAGAARVDHEPARRLECGLAAQVLLYERQRQVHAGGHAGGRPH